ncbi:unnamed protein product [Arabis nemorensis]|uniref:Uncharacterized protein n=1 Tax=Arabis nemorensis TaxID=586526 RepID=A0A565B141_9BRAS|nr:unnamed protein product [Arabis nemorensis]VVB02664.1 unnamed protein product [Arabis nemorensis]
MDTLQIDTQWLEDVIFGDSEKNKKQETNDGEANVNDLLSEDLLAFENQTECFFQMPFMETNCDPSSSLSSLLYEGSEMALSS